MTKYVLDSSALIAVLFKEEGFEKVNRVLADSVLSVVNFSEVISKMLLKGWHLSEVLKYMDSLVPEFVPYSIPIATKAAELILQTNQYGLSLGDRACLATAIDCGYSVITADKIWSKIPLPVKIVLVR